MKIDRRIFRAVGGLRLASAGPATGLRQGDRRSPFRGRGVEFADYRPYDETDDLRLIDWNVYARLETALVKLFHEDRNLTAHIYVDASESMGFGEPRKIDHAGELAAALALLGLLGRDTVTVASFGAEATPVRAVGHNFAAFTQILRALEFVEPDKRGDARRHLATHIARARADRVILITDLLAERDEQDALLRLLAAAGKRPVLAHVLGDEELDPDLSGGLQVVDAETGETITVREGGAAERDYARGLRGWLESIEERCASLGIQYIPAFTTAPVTALMLGELRRGRIVQSAHGGAL